MAGPGGRGQGTFCGPGTAMDREQPEPRGLRGQWGLLRGGRAEQRVQVRVHVWTGKEFPNTRPSERRAKL